MLVVFIWLLCVERCVQPKALKKMIAEEMNHIEINNITYIKRSALPLEHSFRCHCHWIWRDNLTIDTTAIETNPQIQRAWNRVKYSSQSNVIQCILQKALPCLRSGSPFFLQPERCVCVCWWPEQKTTDEKRLITEFDAKNGPTCRNGWIKWRRRRNGRL